MQGPRNRGRVYDRILVVYIGTTLPKVMIGVGQINMITINYGDGHLTLSDLEGTFHTSNTSFLRGSTKSI